MSEQQAIDGAPIIDASPTHSESLEHTQGKLRLVQADATISKHAALAAGTGFIPVPVFDVLATTGVQADLVYRLFHLYEQPVSKEKARNIVTVLLGASLPTLTARAVASGLKFIPGFGTGLAFFASPSLAGASTMIVGTVIRDHLQGGGTFLDIPFEKARATVQHELSKVKTGTSQALHESKERIGNAVDALKGKKPSIQAAENVEATL